MSKPAYNSTINDLVCDANATAPAQAAQKLANMVALADLDTARNKAPWDGENAIGSESTRMIVRLICSEYGVDYQNVCNQASEYAVRRYAELQAEAHDIDRHDRFAAPDENKLRAADALIELVEGRAPFQQEEPQDAPRY